MGCDGDFGMGDFGVRSLKREIELDHFICFGVYMLGDRHKLQRTCGDCQEVL